MIPGDAQPRTGLAGSAWSQRQALQLVQPSSLPDDHLFMNHERLLLPEQQSQSQAGLMSTTGAAGTQPPRASPPGFEDSTAGSQWLEAVQLAGLAEPLAKSQPTMNGQPNHQIWVNTQPVATVRLSRCAVHLAVYAPLLCCVLSFTKPLCCMHDIVCKDGIVSDV